MKKRLLLITMGFPFGEAERGFLDEEARRLAEIFDLYILAPNNADPLLYPVEGVVQIKRYQTHSFRQAGNLRSLCRLLGHGVIKEAWKLARKNGCRQAASACKEVLYYDFHSLQMEQIISEMVETEKIHMVYTYWCTFPTLAAVRLKKRFPQLKVVTRFHGMDLYEERAAYGRQLFRREITQGADGLVFACEKGYAYYLEKWGKKCREKMRICYLGSADLGLLPPAQKKDLTVVSCSSMIPLKRVERIIEALALLPDHMNVRWHHIGDGVLWEHLSALAANRLDSRPNVSWKFWGYVQNAALAELYTQIGPDIFVTASSTEGGAPVSIQEVFSMGIPAIGTAVGGIPDLIINEKTGYLLEADPEPAAIADAIVGFAQLPDEQKRRMSLFVRDHWAHRFNAKKNAEAFGDYLQRLAEN